MPGAQSEFAPGSPLSGGTADPAAPSTVATRFGQIDASPQVSPLGADDRSGGGVAGLLRTIKRRQGLFLFTSVLVTGLLGINTLRERIFSPVYEGGFQMQISNPLEETAALRDTSSLEAIARNSVQTDVPSLIVLLRSPLLIRPMAERQGVNMAQVIANLNISPTSEEVENVLNVSLRWSDPAKGRAILNAISQDYTRFSLTQRQAALDSAIKFLNRQGPQIMSRMNQIQKEMLRFREQNNFLDPSSTAESILGAREQLVANLRQLQTAQVQISSDLKSIETGKLEFNPSGAPTALEQFGRQGVIIPGRGAGPEAAVGAPNPGQQLYDLEQELALARGTFREDSPVVQSLLARRNQLRPVLRQQALDAKRAELLSNIAQQDEINRQILLLNENFRASPEKLSAYEDIQSRLEGARDQYSSYVNARERIRLELARSTTPWQIISPAEFGDIPVEPNIQRNLLRAVVIGLLFGLGAAIIRERTDNVFHTPMEAEKELQLPVLGLIPYLPLEPGVEISASISKMSASERFAIKESLRSLFTTFRLLRADRDIRLVGVTSSTQGEGKSTAVTIFARTLSDLGLRVLIIDADMRLPMQGRYLGVEQGEGLSSLLSDSSIEPSTLIQSIQDNLDIIPAGPKPPDPAKLLNSSRCQEVVDSIRSLPGYDIVLWDAPPCLMLADPILLGEKLDGILFLVGLGKVSRELAPQASRRIKATGVDVLGLICNQVNFPSRLNDYGYEYGYYYHYAYAGAYGRGNRRYGTYGRGLKGYIKRYRDSYVSRGYRDSYLTKRYRNSYLGNRYIRDGYAVQGYQDAALKNENGTTTRNGGPNSNGSTGSGTSTGGRGSANTPSSSKASKQGSQRGRGAKTAKTTSQGPRSWLASRLPFGRGSRRTESAPNGLPSDENDSSAGHPDENKASEGTDPQVDRSQS
ncbi:MAG: polysaccharide biosynthesis tyrosine autokinase [Synechococcaceae cyanobacterium]|nr:polysaccharide biosynthesis tyrosine autokinase [Synechococcaceae cyanobacterium]